MGEFPLKLGKRLEKRKSTSSYRELKFSEDLVDFSSNDYLGFAGNEIIFHRAGEILQESSLLKNGSGGSRLLTGNHQLYEKAEDIIADYHRVEAALIFNSGYDANLGLFSSVAQRGDFIFYDELIHASIRDGIRLSTAKAVKFIHNDLEDLERKINRLKNDISGEIFLVTESVFSMDGDSPDLKALVTLAEKYKIHVIIDEAHAVGVHGAGLAAESGLHQQTFARLVTFGKAFGAHGAAIVGSKELKDYLVNFSRSFIYSTSLPPHTVATIIAAYEFLEKGGAQQRIELRENVKHFKAEVSKRGIQQHFLDSESAVQCCIISGNEGVKQASRALASAGMDVRPIMSPTVAAGEERLRICLHSFNSEEEITELAHVLSKMI